MEHSETSSTQASLVNWFFARLKAIYGTKYTQQFSTEADLDVVKLEWVADITRYTPDQLDTKLAFAKANINHDDYRWPNIGAILKTPINSPTGINSIAYVDQSHQLSKAQASQDTAKAYSIINQLLAPSIMGTCSADKQEQKWAASYVNRHWQDYSDVTMPKDIRAIVHGLR